MTVQQHTERLPVEAFTAAMSQLVSGLAVVTTRGPDGQPCGLLVSSLCSYSVRPPSILMAVDQSTRSYPALTTCAELGVHLLGEEHEAIARLFASRSDAKFARLAWKWDHAVPRLPGVPVYLFCVRRDVFYHGDHAIVVAEVARAEQTPGEPLVYYRRRFDWRLCDAP
jgi:flavin reductase (DIM6/NTAB) family NADH-FMN oxidoreductase RutF